MENQKEASANPYCVKCQTFYGSKANKDMCSKCYKEELELRGEKPVEQKKAVASTTMAAEVSKPSTNAPEEKKDNPLQDDKSKCWNCKKKMGIYGYQCKCGFWFCKMHRIPEDHECTYDFATAGKKQLEKNNPLLVGKKLGEL